MVVCDKRLALPGPDCATKTWTETSDAIAPRASMTERTGGAACDRAGRDNHAVAQVARSLGGGWAGGHGRRARLRPAPRRRPRPRRRHRRPRPGRDGVAAGQRLRHTVFVTASSTSSPAACSTSSLVAAPRSSRRGWPPGPGRGWPLQGCVEARGNAHAALGEAGGELSQNDSLLSLLETTELGSVTAVCFGQPWPPGGQKRRSERILRTGEWRSGSAPALGAGGRGFKSPLPDSRTPRV